LNNGKPVKLYTPKPATDGSGAEVLANVVWSDDASHLLIVSTMDGQPVHRLAAAGGGEPENLTDRYKFNFTGLKFSGSNWRQLYWISPEGLRRVDVDNQTVSSVLADNVTQFWVAKTVARGVTMASFSPDGHFLAFSSPTSIMTYDLEQSAITGTPTVYTVIDQPGQLSNLTWFDTYHLLATRGDHLYWSEYDGANRVDLGPAAGILPGYGTADNRSVVVFRPVGQSVRLMELLIKP
jgi:hypothetical protein